MSSDLVQPPWRCRFLLVEALISFFNGLASLCGRKEAQSGWQCDRGLCRVNGSAYMTDLRNKKNGATQVRRRVTRCDGSLRLRPSKLVRQPLEGSSVTRCVALPTWHPPAQRCKTRQGRDSSVRKISVAIVSSGNFCVWMSFTLNAAGPLDGDFGRCKILASSKILCVLAPSWLRVVCVLAVRRRAATRPISATSLVSFRSRKFPWARSLGIFGTSSMLCL